jgi:hypothetical protein
MYIETEKLLMMLVLTDKMILNGVQSGTSYKDNNACLLKTMTWKKLSSDAKLLLSLFIGKKNIIT